MRKESAKTDRVKFLLTAVLIVCNRLLTYIITIVVGHSCWEHNLDRLFASLQPAAAV